MRMRWLCATVALAWGSLAAPALAAGNAWLEAGRAAVRATRAQQVVPGPARNVILFLGDGMGITTVTAARILEGQRRGEPGEENVLAFESFPYTAFSKVYTTDDADARVRGHDDRDRDGREDELRGALGGRDGAPRRLQGRRRARADDDPRAGGAARPRDGDRHDHDRHPRHARPRPTRTRPTATGRTTRGSRRPRARRASRTSRASCSSSRTATASRSRSEAGARASGRRARPIPSTRPRRAPGSTAAISPQEWTKRRPRSAYVWNREQLDAIDPATTDHLLGLFEPGYMQFESRPSARRRGRALALADDGEGDRPARARTRRLLPDGRGRPHRPRPSRRQRLPRARRDDRALERRARRAREDGSEADADRGDGGSRPRLHVRRLCEARQRHPRQGGPRPTRPQGGADREARAAMRRAGPTRRSATRTAPATPALRPSSRRARSTSRTAATATARRRRAGPTSARSTPPPRATSRSRPCRSRSETHSGEDVPVYATGPGASSSAACASRTISTTRWSKRSAGARERAASRSASAAAERLSCSSSRGALLPGAGGRAEDQHAAVRRQRRDVRAGW